MATKRICSIPNCGKPAKGRGWCGAHWFRWRKHGDPLVCYRTFGVALRYYHEVVLAYDGDDCLIWPHARNHGYGVLRADGRNHHVHRLACEHVNGSPPTPKHEAAHLCGRGKQGCVTKGHLAWKTSAENNADRIVHGTSNRGERCGSAKLTEADVREIRALEGTMFQREIGERYGITYSAVNDIFHRRTWAWLA